MVFYKFGEIGIIILEDNYIESNKCIIRDFYSFLCIY